MKKKLGLKEEYIFLVFACLIFCFGMYGLVKTPRKTSKAENRNLTQFSHFTVNNFLSGKFQDNFENALSDQFAFGEKIRVNYGEAINNLSIFGIKQLVCENRYIKIEGNQYTNAVFNCDDYMVPLPMTVSRKQRQVLYENLDKYNKVNNLADVYYYYFDEPYVVDFTTNEKVIDLNGILVRNLSGHYHFSSFSIDDYDSYKKYYYKTDHHWNYIGSYRGYEDICKMFGKKASEPIGLINNHEYSFGSRARDSRNYNTKEEFAIYDFNIQEYDTYINGEKKTYGHVEEFKTHNYTYNKGTNFYGWVYGGDNGEVLFDFHQPTEDNLLIISNSFDNAIDVLIAQHFNKTYAVDLRHYKEDIGEDFIFSKYIKEKKIDKVLFVMPSKFLFNVDSNQGLEK